MKKNLDHNLKNIKLQDIEGYVSRAVLQDDYVGSDQYIFKYSSFSDQTVEKLRKEFKFSFSKDVFRCYKINNSFYAININYAKFNLKYKDLYMNSVILKILELFEPSFISDKSDAIKLIKKDYLSSIDRPIYEIGLTLLNQILSDLNITLVFCDSNLPKYKSFESIDENTFRK